MRIPGIRFSIGRLMVVVIVAGLILSAARVICSRIGPAIGEQQALANYLQAKLVREVAEYSINECEQGIEPQDMVQSGPITRSLPGARSNKEQAIFRLKWSGDLMTRGLISGETNLADKLTQQKAEFDLRQACEQRWILEAPERNQRLKSLGNDLAKARAEEVSKLVSYHLERARRLWSIGF